MHHARSARLARALVAVTVLAAAAPLARAACAGFGAGASYVAGGSPQAVVSGDFDHDGIADLAVANLTGSALVVLRGLGGGAFAAPVEYASGTAGRAVASGDFNGDGVTDLAVAVSNGVAVWFGGRDGRFSGGAVTLAGSSPRGIACADLDRDGISDLALTSSATNAVLVLRGNGADGIGNGTFAAPVAYPVGANPARVLVADLDGDGIADLCVANNSGASVSILRGNGANGVGDGTFAPATTVAVAGSPWAAAALDWNGDGLVDLVVSNGAGTSVALLRGAGGGAFVAAGTIATPTAPRDLVVGDFDGDGRVDVAAACAVGNDVVVLRGTGAGLALLGTFATGSGAGGLAAGDWNGDGAPDLACANAGTGSVTRLLGACPAAASAHVTLLAPLGHETWWPGTLQEARWVRGAGVAAVDVDLSRDGGANWLPLARGLTADHVAIPALGVPDPHLRVRVADALVPARADASADDVMLCGLFAPALPSDIGLAATQLAAADLDGDGLPDLVACDATHAAVLRGDGAGHFTVIVSYPADSTRRLALADATGDGLADLVRLTPAGVAVRAGDGRGGFGAESVRALSGGTGLAVRDFDGDGVADIAVLAADGAGSRLVVWRSGTPASPWSAAVAGAPGAIACADLDGDGIADLALGAGTSVQVWTGTGTGGRGDGAFRPGVTGTLPVSAGDLALADTNGDGAPDVIACLPATGDLVTVTSPAPTGGAAAGGAAPDAAGVPVVVAAGANPCAPVIADLDGDGRPDLVLALAGEGAIAVLEGADGGFAGPARFALGAGVSALAVDDFTGDGLPDVVAAGGDGRLYCLPAQCPPRLPATLVLAPATFADTSAALAGFTRTLAWSRSASIAAARVELSRDGGAHWSTLADGVSASAFRWVASGPACAAARLRVRDAACGARFDETPAFAIRDAFAPGPSGAAPAGGTQLAAGDVDGDGIADAVVAAGDSVVLLRGDGAGGFHAVWSDADPGVRRLRLADLDGDGASDLLTLHYNDLWLRRGDGHGAFAGAQAIVLEGPAVDFAVADVDADGVPDLVSTSGDGVANRVSVRRGLGVGPDGAIALSDPWYGGLPSPPTSMAVADVNGDGVADLVVAHATGVATLLGNRAAGHATGTFHLAGNRSYGRAHLDGLRLADLDGDGRVDLVASDTLEGTVVFAQGDGAGGFGAPNAFSAGGAPLGPAIADLDRDGTLDLVVPTADGSLTLLRGIAGAPPASRFVTAARIAGGAGAAAFARTDTDGDGVADVLALDGSGVLRMLRGLSGAAGPPRLAQPAGDEVAVGAALTLHWAAPAGVAAVDVELSRDDGVHWSRLASGIAGGAWTWSVSGPGTYAARLRVRDADVPLACDSASAAFRIASGVAGVAPGAPATLELGAPWPNPARAGTQFVLSLPAAGAVRIEACDVAGRHVRTLFAGALPAGVRTLRWNGEDDHGRPLPQGLYFVRARTPGASVVRRVVLAR